MPLSGDQYQKRTKQDILDFLQSEMREEYGEDIDLTESSAFRTFAEAIATVDAEDVEAALKEVHDAGFIESATGDHLDKLLSIIGVSRQPASHATGTVKFDHQGTVSQSHDVPNGLTIQTDSESPTEFETTEIVTMFLRDDFEGGTLDSKYAGDRANFSVVDGSAAGDPSPVQGSNMLKSDGTGDVSIVDNAVSTYVGHTMDFYVYMPSSSIVRCFFGYDSNNSYKVELDDSANEHEILKTASGSTSALTTNTGVTIPTGEWLRIEIAWLPDGDATIRSRIYNDSDGDGNYDDLVDEAKHTGENEIVEGGYGFEAASAHNIYWDWAADRSVLGDARAVESGPEGNVGASTLTVTSTAVSGVNDVFNPHPMGDTSHLLTSLHPFDAGRDEESDEDLRDRARESEGAAGDGTIPAVLAELREIDDVQSVTLYENKTDTDNTGSGGLPPKSFEAVVFGTASDQTIGEALFSVKGMTAHDYGGAHGTAKSHTVKAENEQSFTMDWSEPTELAVDMTLDIVVNDSYIGDEELKDRIVSYIGGVDSNGSEVIGTDVAENVVINQLEDEVVGPDDTGVIGVDTSGTSYTPTTTTDSNGLEVISVGADEVGTTNAQDGSITLTVTTV